jgi:UDP-N-acetylglucosamine 2-epimerase (non-hydrolysing)
MLRVKRPRILLPIGTRPECLKLASLIRALRRRGDCEVTVLDSGQHHAMVQRTLTHLNVPCDVACGQREPASLTRTLRGLRECIGDVARSRHADVLVAQGDTSTAYATALAARELGLPLAHVEAGLRTAHPLRPFPEEMFRRRIAPIAALHFAPTEEAERNLLAEGIAASRIHRLGNTAMDLLREQIESPPHSLAFLPDEFRSCEQLIALTLHRRENYGRGLEATCAAILELLAAEPELHLVCPVHPNPVVGNRIRSLLAKHPRIALLEALDYSDFIALLQHARLVITDSGGIQEEAPFLGLPALVVRTNTERPESIALGYTHLVPPCQAGIVANAQRLLAQPKPPRLPFDAAAPFGDGRSGERIASILIERMRRTSAAELPAFALPEICDVI